MDDDGGAGKGAAEGAAVGDKFHLERERGHMRAGRFGQKVSVELRNGNQLACGARSASVALCVLFACAHLGNVYGVCVFE